MLGNVNDAWITDKPIGSVDAVLGTLDGVDNSIWAMKDAGLVGNVGVMSRRQHPPNDMSSRHMSACRRNKMSSQPAK